MSGVPPAMTDERASGSLPDGLESRSTTEESMPQIHLRAEPGDYAPIVLLPGDPNRATVVAGMFDGGLEGARRVNDHRAMYGYTGTYQGVPVSVQTTGMGTPSLSIVVEELLRLGARRLIRIGTCGGIGRGIRTTDLVIASAATPFDGATHAYLHGEPYAPTADFGLVRALVDRADAHGATYHVGQVCTVDVLEPHRLTDLGIALVHRDALEASAATL